MPSNLFRSKVNHPSSGALPVIGDGGPERPFTYPSERITLPGYGHMGKNRVECCRLCGGCCVLRVLLRWRPKPRNPPRESKPEIVG